MISRSLLEKQLRRLELEARRDYLLNKIKNLRIHQGSLFLNYINLKDKIKTLSSNKEIIESVLEKSDLREPSEYVFNKNPSIGNKVTEIKENLSRIFIKNQEIKTQVEALQKSMVAAENIFNR